MLDKVKDSRFKIIKMPFNQIKVKIRKLKAGMTNKIMKNVRDHLQIISLKTQSSNKTFNSRITLQLKIILIKFNLKI